MFNKKYLYNSSTPGFKAMKLQDHRHFTDFKNELLQQKNIIFSVQNGDAGEKISGNNADSQEQIRQLTSNEIMTDYCQFTIQSLMGCYKNAGGLKKVIAFNKSICLKNITGDQSYTYLLYFLHLYYLQNLTQIK
jgi:hypothetical protein